MALKNLVQLNDVHQQYKILDVMLKGLFKVCTAWGSSWQTYLFDLGIFVSLLNRRLSRSSVRGWGSVGELRAQKIRSRVEANRATAGL